MCRKTIMGPSFRLIGLTSIFDACSAGPYVTRYTSILAALRTGSGRQASQYCLSDISYLLGVGGNVRTLDYSGV